MLCGVVRAAQAEGWTVSLHDMNGTATDSALFRRSPGNTYASAGSQNFTHFVLSRTPAPSLEAHIGIKVAGKSDVVHECDVALLPEEAASFCRSHHVHPRSSQLVLFVECKFLAGNVPLHLGRGFVGLDIELKSQYGECYFVANTSSSSVMKMLARLRWPTGFACLVCGHHGALGDGRLMCSGCGNRTAGTIFDRTRTPLTVWFNACWLFASGKDGISALSLKRTLDGSYQTAWAMLHRLRAVLVRPGRNRLGGMVQVDETYIGGVEPGLGGGRAPGKKVLTGIGVEVREPKGRNADPTKRCAPERTASRHFRLRVV